MDDGPSHLRLRLSILMFLLYAVPGAFVPLLTPRLTEIHFTPLEIGAIGATQALAALVGTWLAGQLADRWVPAERCLSVAGFVGAVCLWVLADQTTPGLVFVVSLGFWLMMVPATMLGTSLCFTHLRDPQRDYGPVRLWGTIGWIFSNLLLGVWFNEHWRPSPFRSELADIFRLGAILAVVLGVYACTLPHTPPAPQSSIRFAPLEALRLLRQPAFAVFALCNLGLVMTLPFPSQVTPLLLEQLGIEPAWLPPTLTLNQSIEVVSLALLPILLLRLGMRGTMRLGLGAWLVALSILMLGRPTWLVIASLPLNGLFICCYLVAGQVFVNSRARGEFRRAQGLLAFLNGLGLLFGNLLVGVVRQEVHEAIAPTFAVAVMLTGLLSIVFLAGFPPDEKVEPLGNGPDRSESERNEEGTGPNGIAESGRKP